MRKIDNSKLENLEQLTEESICLFHLIRDIDLAFKNVLKSLFVIKKMVFANLSDHRIKRYTIAKIPTETMQILEDLNHIANISNELAKSLRKFN